MEPTPAVEHALHILYLIGIVLACGSLSGFIASKLHIPDIVVYLIVGIVLGPEMSGIIHVDSGSTLNQMILLFGAAYIIFEGGSSVALKVLKEVWLSLVILATVGVIITMALMGFAAHWVFGIPILTAMLLGAVLASTDPATLIPIFKQVPIKERVSHLVMSESALNDPMGAIVTIIMLGLAMGTHEFSISQSLSEFSSQVGLGILFGCSIGFAALILIAHKKLNFLHEYMEILTVVVVAGGYTISEHFGASGYMAAFVAGIIFGNKKLFGLKLNLIQEEELERFVSSSSLILRMFIFILLGSQVNFELLDKYWLGGAILVSFFMLVARPVTVFICCLVDRRAKWQLKELLFICWVRETGVIPAALAGILLGIGAPHADLIASVTFMAILLTIIVQATTTKWWAKKLDLLVEP